MAKKLTHSWSVDKHGHINCVKIANDQYVTVPHKAAELSNFHDAELAQATLEISDILQKVQDNNRDKTRQLAWINVHGRLFLVWTQYAIGPNDDFDTIAEALKLEREDVWETRRESVTGAIPES